MINLPTLDSNVEGALMVFFAPPGRLWTGTNVTPSDILPDWNPFGVLETLQQFVPFSILPYILVKLNWIVGFFVLRWFTQYGRGLVRWKIGPNRLTYITEPSIEHPDIRSYVETYNPATSCLVYVVDATAQVDTLLQVDITRAGVFRNGALVYHLPVWRWHATKYDRWKNGERS